MAEHTSMGGAQDEFTSHNFGLRTTPAKEWAMVVGEVECTDTANGRRMPKIGDLMALPMTREAELTRAEVISLSLYSGPMVSFAFPTRSSFSMLGCWVMVS